MLSERSKLISKVFVWFFALSTWFSLIWYFPQTLSHYSLMIAGQHGAEYVGMEPTYWWDGLDQETIDWLHENTELEDTICFSPTSPYNLKLLRDWKLLNRETKIGLKQQGKYYILQNRPSAMGKLDWEIRKTQTPVWTKTIHSNPNLPAPWRLDIPLILIYKYEDAIKVKETLKQDS